MPNRLEGFAPSSKVSGLEASARSLDRKLGRTERAEAPQRSSFAEVLRALGRRVDAGEAVVRKALHSDLGGLDARALIAVQAGIYHYTEAIELAGKLVDRAASAVRTVLQPGGH